MRQLFPARHRVGPVSPVSWPWEPEDELERQVADPGPLTVLLLSHSRFPGSLVTLLPAGASP